MDVNWRLIVKALDFYRARGYLEIPTPWSVSEQAIRVTYPEGDVTSQGGGLLVGSAEQGFLELALRGVLPSGFLVSAGPCFRNDRVDPARCSYPHFFKVEIWGPFGADARLFRDARDFHARYVHPHPVKRRISGEEIDLEINGVEVGSYGSRRHQDIAWSFGTGLAEPRASFAASQARCAPGTLR